MIACDGMDVDTLLQNRVAPFVDRRTHLEGTRSALAIRLTNAWWVSHLWQSLGLSSCAMEIGAGNVQDFPLRWRTSDEGLRMLMHERPEQKLRPWRSGAWIQVSNFMPSESQLDDFDRLLEDVRQAGGMKLVVLDTRGNSGGNSLFGVQLLAALLKDRMPIDELQPQAYWRVSPLAIQAMERNSAALNSASLSLKATRQLLDSLLREMQDAKKNGEAWVRQKDLDWDSVREVSGPAFRGRIVLVTDAQCTSACLDFVDLVLGVPEVIHVGAPTSADTRYLDGTDVRLPSGLTMMIPLKVWRGRARGDNEPRVPKYVFRGDMWNTPAIERWLWDEVLPSVEAGNQP
ncbi:MAG: peptidase [Rhizobacter sp.]|nr:peptidase [Rhizobacter sp.]